MTDSNPMADNEPRPRRRTPAPLLDGVDRFVDLATVRAITGLSRSTVYEEVAAGNFPRQRRISRARVAWRLSEVTAWMDSRPEADAMADNRYAQPLA